MPPIWPTFLLVVGGRGQAQIWVFWPVLGGLAGGERCWSSTALITSRALPRPQTLLAELPVPGAVPDGVVIVLGSQTMGPLDERVQHHLTEPAGGKCPRR